MDMSTNLKHSTDKRIFYLFGNTGAGKTSFINAVRGDELGKISQG